MSLIANAGSFSMALRAELEETGVTCLMPGATRRTFSNAGMLGTKVGQSEGDPADVAKVGFDA